MDMGIGTCCGRNGRRIRREGEMVKNTTNLESNLQIGDRVVFFFTKPVNEKFELTGKDIKISLGKHKGIVVLENLTGF